ncbi:urease accessory protein UreE [Methylophaga sp.]|uniref:urease accessory protein UreE n=1 Tax=Methylophaga sp. TaxID=2024840 RepID=UPI003F694F8D
MLEFHTKLPHSHAIKNDDSVALSYDIRQKSRIRVTLASGVEAAIFMPRGTILRGGDQLEATDGRIIKVIAAEQAVLKVTADSPKALTRACYHLGNRHVPLEIGDGWLKLETDDVLKQMLLGLGDIRIDEIDSPFEPEAGAYGGGHHHHHADDEQVHSHHHAHA